MVSVHPAFSKTPVIGEPAPDFQVTTFDGKKLTLGDFKGQVLILNFWATWCGPCKQELPLLDRYYELRHEAGLRVIGITTEDSAPARLLAPLAAAFTLDDLNDVLVPLLRESAP